MREIRYGILCLSLAIVCLSMQNAACSDNATHYIAQFKDLAIREQNLTGIPASIKLSMALLESNNGQSYLAIKGNNHFGIKWWNAATDGASFIEVFDDDKNKRGKPIVSRFIKFSSAEASYKKHSEVLKRPRYSILFTYATNDYRSWALGLGACGYATAKDYGARLIELIERYNLTQYDVLLKTPLNVSFNDMPVDNRSFMVSNPMDSGTEIRATEQTEQTPQYAPPLKQVAPAAKGIDPVQAPLSPVIESRFTNKQGQTMRFVLYEVEGEEVKPKKVN